MIPFDSMSNRSLLWLSGTIIGVVVALSMIWSHTKEINNAGLLILIIGGTVGLLFLLYRCSLLWHGMHLRKTERKKAHAELKRVETNIWISEQSLLHQQEMEREGKHIEMEHIRTEQLRLNLEHTRLMVAAEWNAKHMVVPTGHTAIIAAEVEYTTVAALREPRQLEKPRDEHKRVLEQSGELPAPVDVYDLLVSGVWSPDGKYLFLALSQEGLISVAYNLAWHIALAGSTGNGKTNELRLLLAQMVLFYDVYYISPAFAPVKVNHEDWRQIEAYLKAPVARKAEEIAFRLQWVVNEIERREDMEHAGDHSWAGQRIYLVIDEFKEVVARYPGTSEDVSSILRRARQFDIFVIVAAQDFLIKNIGGDSGARDCYRTALYFGGDPNTCRALLDISGTLPFEQDLGKQGHLVLRTRSTQTSQARAPFMSNRAIYELLGWPDDPILDDAPVTALREIRASAGTAWTPEKQPISGSFGSPVGASPKVSESSILTPRDRITGELQRTVSELVDTRGHVPNGSPASPVEKQFTPEQEVKFVTLFRQCQNIKDCLRTMHLGNVYHRHASTIVAQRKLRRPDA